ncbi:MAG: Rid family hydrolase [Pseudomonadota bacterium]
MPTVETFTPEGSVKPIGPYNHIAVVGDNITIGGVAGFDPETGQLAGPDVCAQTRQILNSFADMLETVGSDLNHVVHVNVFLKDIAEFSAMNATYSEVFSDHLPARTAFQVADLPKPGLRVTMNLTAVKRDNR